MPFSGCKKAGEGGKATLNVYVFNATNNVPYATVKIKYGATGYPGASANYNAEHQCDYRGQISISELKKGDYYLYAFNFDSTSTLDPLPIWEGGTQFEITNRNGERSVVIDMSNDPE